jgi:hypothetical protein
MPNLRLTKRGRHEHRLAGRAVGGHAERGVCGGRGRRGINRQNAVAGSADPGDEEVGRVVKPPPTVNPVKANNIANRNPP